MRRRSRVQTCDLALALNMFYGTESLSPLNHKYHEKE